MKYACLLLLLTALSALMLGQKKQSSTIAVDPEVAKEYFTHKNYIKALPLFRELTKQQPQSSEYNLKTGLCYLRTSINKAAAVPYLEFICRLPKPSSENYFYLGRAYQFAYRFDEAIGAFEKCKESAKSDLFKQAERQIELCNNAKELVKYPLDVSFINLGKQINSEYPDYNPFIPADESFLVFTSRRPRSAGETPEMDGYFSSDIYLSTPKNGTWQKPKDAGAMINSKYDEQVVDLSNDGKKMIIYLDHIDSLGNIYICENGKSGFGKPLKMSESVNSGFETSGSISPEEDMIIFSSKREGGYGETDLYMEKKLPNGQWSKEQLIGNEINTKYKEDFPHIAPDGKTLYFASEGHSSMGGFDLFKAIYDRENNSWSNPENLGYPINTPDDDLTISITADSCYGYLSSSRDGGFGDLDLYKVKFNSKTNRYCIVNGYVSTSDTMGPYIKKSIVAIKSETKEMQKFTPIKSSGKYIMALTPGKYTLTVTAEGYEDYNYLLSIVDVPFQPEQKLDIQLSRKK